MSVLDRLCQGPRQFFDITQAHIDRENNSGQQSQREKAEYALARSVLGRVQQGDLGRRVFYGGGQPTATENMPQWQARLAAMR